MIIFTVHEIDDFVSFLPRRIHAEIFYDFVKSNFEGLAVSLAFVAKMEQTNILVQTKLKFPSVHDKEAILKKIKDLDFGKPDFEVKFIHGSIKELYVSIS